MIFALFEHCVKHLKWLLYAGLVLTIFFSGDVYSERTLCNMFCNTSGVAIARIAVERIQEQQAQKAIKICDLKQAPQVFN